MNPTVRVASVPAAHPYVEHLAPVGPTDVVRLPDPPVIGEDGTTRWWPPRMLDPGWLRHHRDDLDVLHVHFGFESFTPAQLRDVVDALDEIGRPLVLTVHDLRNPHLADAAAQLDRLDVLVPAAAAVITLTPGAAAAIEERWGVRAFVVPHPHIVPLDRPSAVSPRADAQRVRVGLHLKSLRRNVDALGALQGLALVARAHDVDVVVTMHRAITDPADRGYDADVVGPAQRLADEGLIDLRLHDPMDDDALFAHVAALDISVMANVWGTHSGWIEMCHDLGVRVVAPRIGFYGEQHAPLQYDLADDVERIDPERLADAVTRALTLPRVQPASTAERLTERAGIAAAHERIYRSVIAR